MELDQDREFATKIIKVGQKLYDRFAGNDRNDCIFSPIDFLGLDDYESILNYLEKRELIKQKLTRILVSAEDYYKLTYKKVDGPYEPYEGGILIEMKDKERFFNYFLELKKSLQNNPKPRSEFKFPHKLPSGTKWENITIIFLSDEEVLINAYRYKIQRSYKQMGFENSRNGKPIEIWSFFKVLAKLAGELSIKDPEVKDVYKKQKSDLEKLLQEYFSIDWPLFWPYSEEGTDKKKNSYKIRLNLWFDQKQDVSKNQQSLEEEIAEMFRENSTGYL